MKSYEIIQPNNKCFTSKYVAIVVATTGYECPVDVLFKIEDELSKQNLIGDVLFDNMLFLGHLDAPCVVINFNGTTFDIAKTQTIPKPTEVRQQLGELYHEHPEWVDDSNLPKAVRFLAKKQHLYFVEKVQETN